MCLYVAIYVAGMSSRASIGKLIAVSQFTVYDHIGPAESIELTVVKRVKSIM